MRRIAVTGVGNVSPIGNDAESAWKSLMAGKGGIGKITRFDASDLACQIAGEVKDFDATKYIPAAELRRNDLFIVYGVCAAMEAIADAGLDDDATLDKRRVGVVIGSGIGGLPAIERNVLIAAERPRRVSPFFIPSAIGNMISGYLSIAKGYQGPSYGIVSACTTGTHCVGDAMDLIRSGRVDVAVAGGVEAVYTVLAVKNQVSPPTINIFDQDFERGCDLDYCANEARPMKIDYAISNSFGFGGTNGTVVFKRFEG